MRRSVKSTKTGRGKQRVDPLSVRRRCFFYGCLFVIAAGVLFLAQYYSRQIDFIRIRSLTANLDLQFTSSSGRQVETTITRPGAVSDRRCRVLTEAESLTRIRILARGVLVLYGSCELTIHPNRRHFWFLHRGEVAFFPDRDGRAVSDRHSLRPPLDFQVAAASEAVDQGRTVILKVESPVSLKRVSGSLDWRSIRFFADKKKKRSVFHAIQGVDVSQHPGLRKLAFRAVLPSGEWLLRVYPYRIHRRRHFHPYRQRAKRVRLTPRRLRRGASGRFWRRWLAKKKYILSENRPNIEWKMLQPIYKNIAIDRLWEGRFREPMLRYQRVSSPFGVVRYLTSGDGIAHRGIDYASPAGWPVRATARGRVVFAGRTVVRGGLVIVDHGLGVFSTYMHLSRVLARSNEMVGPGKRVGLVGSTGLSTGPHLHFGVKVGNVFVDPGEWMRRPPYPGRRWYPLVYTDDPDAFVDPDE